MQKGGIRQFILAAAVAAVLLSPVLVAARAGGGGYSGGGHHSTSSGTERRSRATTREFQREHPCPSTGSTSGACPGYTKDHIIALKRGGPDSPSNMQWQTKEEAKAKDKWE